LIVIQFNISDAADQQFATILNGRRVTIRLRYNVTSEHWSMDLSVDDQPVLRGRRVVTGVDLLQPFRLGIGAIFAWPQRPDLSPNRNNLPRALVGLYHASAAEIAAVT
jgi:hypothetical protein